MRINQHNRCEKIVKKGTTLLLNKILSDITRFVSVYNHAFHPMEFVEGDLKNSIRLGYISSHNAEICVYEPWRPKGCSI